MIAFRKVLPQSIISLCLVFFCGVQLFCSSPARALNPKVQITQYAHTAWRMQDGSISSPPTAIEQTDDGYIWVGTHEGLMRFDGVRFTSWQPAPDQKLPNNDIWGLLKDRDGSLWIGTGRGLAHLVAGRLTTFPSVIGVVEQIIQDREGTVWFTRARFDPSGSSGPLCQVHRLNIKCFGASEGVSFPFANALEEDSQGYLLVGSDVSLIRWKAGSSEKYAPQGLQGAKNLYGVSALSADPDGSMWVGMFRGGKGLGLQHVVDSKWNPIRLPGLDTSTLAVTNLFKDRDGSLWIGTLDKGIYRIDGNHADHYGASDGLSSDYVRGIGEDSEGDVWIFTGEGLDRFHALPVVSYTVRQGLSFPQVNSVFAARDGSLWMGTSGGIDILKDGAVSHLVERDGLPGKIVSSVFQDHRGQFWLSVDDNLIIYNGSFSIIKRADGKPLGSYDSIAEDANGAMWICASSTSGTTLYRVQDRHVQEMKLPAGTSPPASVAANAEGGIWIGLSSGDLASYNDGHLTIYPVKFPSKPATYAFDTPLRNVVTEPEGTLFATHTFGLLEKHGGVIKYLTELNGLPRRYLSSFQRDVEGNLYLFEDGNILSISGPEMERWWNNPTSKVNFTLYGAGEGARPGVAYYEPSTARTADGRLWFSPAESSLQMVDPGRLASNKLAPPVAIEELMDDGKTSLVQDGLRLPPRLRSLRLDYTALSFVAPQKMRFRYKLEGHDADWVDAGTRRQAFYNDLPPGQYRFHVIASNNDGVWNNEGASLSFYVAPAFYQRLWFKAVVGLFTLIALWLLYMHRLAKATQEVSSRLMERLAERERIARDLHDTFFQGIQGLLLRFNTGTSQLSPTEPARPIFLAALEQSDRVMLEGRKLVLDLRETNESTVLEDALAQAGGEFRSLHPAEFKLTVLGEPRSLRSTASSELYSLAKEAIYNAFRHANAKLIEVELNYTSEGLNIRIRDDGRGMEEDVVRDRKRAGHWGLPGMSERAENLGGTLTLWSRAGSGTELEVSIPAEVAYRDGPKSSLLAWMTRWFRPRRSITD
jgi:signal transduction histidine kinase/ligand-binding sensor domain-containing protein